MQNNPNNYIQDPLANAYRRVYNQPIYSTQPIQQQVQPVQPQLSPEVLGLINQDLAQPYVSPQAEQLKQDWRGVRYNWEGHPVLSDAASMLTNIPLDLLQIGTGLVSAGVDIARHPIQSARNAYDASMDYLGDLYARSERPMTKDYHIDNKLLDVALGDVINTTRYGYNVGKDIWNAFAGSVPILNTKTVGSIIEDLAKGKDEQAFKTAKEAGAQSYEQLIKDPLITALMVAPNTTTKALKTGTNAALNTVEKVTGVAIGQNAKKVASGLEVLESKFAKENAELSQAANSLAKASKADLELVMKNADTGSPIPKHLEGLRDEFKAFQEKYGQTLDPNSLVNPNELAALQYVQRMTGKTLQEIRRELTPQLEALQEGITNPSLKFSNRLSDLEQTINTFRKDKTTKNFLSDKARLSELTANEAEILGQHLTADELGALKAAGATVKEAKQYLGDLTRDVWKAGKVSEAALKDTIFQENMSKLAALAEQSGNTMYKHLYDGMRLANEGKIYDYTFAGAKIPEGGLVSNEGRRFQGKSSSREYGTATYKDLSEAYKNIHQFLDDVTLQKVKDEIATNILNNGTIEGVTELVSKDTLPKNVRYLDRALVESGSLSEALQTASTNATEGAIAIDKSLLNSLSGMLKPTGTPYKKGILGDIYNMTKENMLASGIYLGGNLLSGVFGTMMNSGTPTGLIKDIVASIGSKGALAKELGTFRNIRPTDRRYSSSIAKGVSSFSRRWLGTGVMPRIDAMMQNMFAEINAHSNLRKMGIAQDSRLSSIRNMQTQKLAKVIDNVRTYSMMNSKYRIFPRGEIRDILGIANPFLDWTDTATQVTAKMLVDHPVLMGAVASKLFGDIAFDKELQKRLNLGVYTNKPLVTYLADSKAPNGAKEATINFLPQLSSIEFFGNPSKILTGNSGAPLLTAIYEATKGKTPYGNPMRRSHPNNDIQTIMNGTRYMRDPKTGNIKEITDTMGDEVLSTTIRNLIAPVSLVNKTVMPAGVSIYNAITGDNKQWYMPYGQSIFGSLKTGQPERGEFSRNILSTGDPRNTRSVEDIVKGLGTYYERDYYPQGELSGNQIRRIIRAGARQNRRDLGE